MELEEAIERLKRGIEDTMFSTLYSQEQEEEDIKTVLKELNRKNGIINALQCALKERTDERDKKDDEISKLRAVTTKQEKMIELMIEYLNIYGVEDDICTDELSKDCNENCKECIKQYFEKKAEERNNMNKETFIEMIKNLPIDKIVNFNMEYKDFETGGNIKTLDFSGE